MECTAWGEIGEGGAGHRLAGRGIVEFGVEESKGITQRAQRGSTEVTEKRAARGARLIVHLLDLKVGWFTSRASGGDGKEFDAGGREL
jgi:hypothetical protein